MIARSPPELLPLDEYDHILISFSGGKDSLACVVHLLELGADPSRIELWHQSVDGDPSEGVGLMDWPVTEAYCRAAAESLGLTLRFQWKQGGIEQEMLRENARTAGITFEDGEGGRRYLEASSQAKRNTRLMFPQVSADLRVRWCSAYVKIDVARRAINNDPRFRNAKILYITGERREESTARSKYAEVERHACHNSRRRVDAWRPVIDWSEERVWAALQRHRIRPHPAYELGWGRVSCMTCIFGDRDQWASIRRLAPDRFQRIAAYEQRFGKTIHRTRSVFEQADRGQSFIDDKPESLKRLALSRSYPVEYFRVPEGEPWTLPAGAYKRCGGPS